MPIHYSVDKWKIEKELEILKDAGKKVLYILPQLLKINSGGDYYIVQEFMIIFEDKE